MLLLDTKQNNPNYYIVLAIEAALRAHPQVAGVTRAGYANAIRLAQRKPYDLLLAVDGEEGNREILVRLKSLVGLAVLWCWEDPYETRQTVRLAAVFDYVFTNDRASTAAYSPPAYYLPLAAVYERPVLDKDSDYDFDLAFVGSAWPNRVLFLRKLLRVRPHLCVRIGLAYNEHLPNVYLDMPESSYVGAVSHADFLDIANRSRINLVLHRSFSGDGAGRRAQTPGPRLFEAALAGGFQLVDGEGMALAGLYRDGREVVSFEGMDDCVAKIDRLLGTPARRIAMARAAQKRTATDHLYASRVATLLGIVLPATNRLPALLAEPAQPRRRRVLFVTHNRVANGNFGGVEVYQETLANQMRADYEIFYYQPQASEDPGTTRSYVLTNSRHRVLREVSVPGFDPMTQLWQAESEDAFAGVLAEFGIELVHFHHLINHCASLPLVCEVLGVPTVYTFQDFWTVCSRFNLIDHKQRYCRIHERSRTACDVCLGTAEGRPPGSQAVRRSFFSRVLRSIDRIVFNSPSSAEICRQVFPELPETALVQLGLPLPWAAMHGKQPSRSRPAENDPRAPLQVLFLGNFTFGKGAETFLEAARFMRDDNVAFTIAGRVDEGYAGRLASDAMPNVTVMGGFTPGTLDFSAYDVSLHLSVWPETYCITLSEAWRAGVVPVVTACGALADRVHNGIDGFTVPIDGSGDVVDVLRRLESNRRELSEIGANIASGLWLTPEQHCETLRALYCELHGAIPATRPCGPGSEAALPGATPIHAVLAASRAFPPNWPQMDWPRLPSLPAAKIEPRNPARVRAAAIRAAIAGHNFDIGHLTVCVDALAAVPPHGAIQVSGWVRSEGRQLEGVSLMLRSCNGDLVVCPVFLHERADLGAASAGPGMRLGFLSEPFAAELLEDDGLYALEFATWMSGRLSICPLPAALAHTGGRWRLIQGLPGRVVQQPFAGPAAPSRLGTANDRFQFRLDDFSVTDLADEGQPAMPVLAVDGWILPDDEADGCVTVLELRGPATYRCELTAVARPDVLDAFAVVRPLRCGVQGRVWLGAMRPGHYSAVLVQSAGTMRCNLLVGEVAVGAASAALPPAEQPAACLQIEFA